MPSLAFFAMLLASLPAAMGGERSMPSAELFFDNGESFYAQPGGNTVKLVLPPPPFSRFRTPSDPPPATHLTAPPSPAFPTATSR